MVLFEKGKQKAGAFNFTKSVFREEDYETYMPYYKEAYDKMIEGEKKKGKKNLTTAQSYYSGKWRTFQMSDHLPLWVELKIDFSDEYLKGLAK